MACWLRLQAILGRTLRSPDCVHPLPSAPSQRTEIHRHASRARCLRGSKLKRFLAPSIPVGPDDHLPGCKPHDVARGVPAKRAGPPNIRLWQRWRAQRILRGTGFVPLCCSYAASGSMKLSVIDACERRLSDDAGTVPDAAPNVRNGSKADAAGLGGKQTCSKDKACWATSGSSL